jgi:hypothetical protein
MKNRVTWVRVTGCSGFTTASVYWAVHHRRKPPENGIQSPKIAPDFATEGRASWVPPEDWVWSYGSLLGLSGLTNDGHRNRTSGHSRVLHDRPKIGLGSTGIVLPRRILVLATGIAPPRSTVTTSLPSSSLFCSVSLSLGFSPSLISLVSLWVCVLG